MNSCLDCDGLCCLDYLVPLTHRDVLKLVSATKYAPEFFVEFKPVDEFTCHYPDVRLEDGYFYMVLKRVPSRSGEVERCVFMSEVGGKGGKCSIHAHKPMLCRTYPFQLDDSGKRLEFSRKSVCPGKYKAARNEIKCMGELFKEREKERLEYGNIVLDWNRKNLKKRKREDFLNLILSLRQESA